jgi:hypothetical protein
LLTIRCLRLLFLERFRFSRSTVLQLPLLGVLAASSGLPPTGETGPLLVRRQQVQKGAVSHPRKAACPGSSSIRTTSSNSPLGHSKDDSRSALPVPTRLPTRPRCTQPSSSDKVTGQLLLIPSNNIHLAANSCQIWQVIVITPIHASFTNVAMRRIQLIEIHEQPWFPSSIRDQITDTLQFGLNFTKVYVPMVPLLQRLFDSMPSQSIVDLCSGGGGPWLDLSRRLRADAFHVCLTDKYPNLKAFENVEAVSENHVSFYRGSVDATRVPPELEGLRTIFTSFHHFAPEDARAVLQNAVDARQAIGIFEITRRTLPSIALMFLWALTPLALIPFIRPFRWSQLLWTYVIPIIPLVLLFDGVVSCLRTYEQQELNAFVDVLTGAEYEWETGEHSGGSFKLPISYLIGYPRRGPKQLVVSTARIS